MKKNKVLSMCQGAMTAALYVILSLLSSIVGLQSTPLRLSEALCILPCFMPAAVPGLFVGCFISNLILGGALPDIIFGSMATLIGAVGTRTLCRQKHGRWLAAIPPIIANTLIIPPILTFCYGYGDGIIVIAAGVALSELLSCGVMGAVLYSALMPLKNRLFK